jgi:MFS family permease
MSDIFGRKALLLWTYTVFGLGCLFCGLARNMTELILARAVAGVGGGGLTTIAAILLSDVTTLRERGTWQGYVNIVFGSGGALGSCMGGMLVDGIGWRW